MHADRMGSDLSIWIHQSDPSIRSINMDRSKPLSPQLISAITQPKRHVASPSGTWPVPAARGQPKRSLLHERTMSWLRLIESSIDSRALSRFIFSRKERRISVGSSRREKR